MAGRPHAHAENCKSAQNESEKMIMNDWQSREEEEQRVKIEKIGSDKEKEINKEKRRNSK